MTDDHDEPSRFSRIRTFTGNPWLLALIPAVMVFVLTEGSEFSSWLIADKITQEVRLSEIHGELKHAVVELTRIEQRLSLQDKGLWDNANALRKDVDKIRLQLERLEQMVRLLHAPGPDRERRTMEDFWNWKRRHEENSRENGSSHQEIEPNQWRP